MALLSSQTPKCSSSRTGSMRARRTISRLPALSLALATLISPAAAAAEQAPLSRHILRCSHEPPQPEGAPSADQPPTAEHPAEPQPAAPTPRPPAGETTALDEAEL